VYERMEKEVVVIIHPSPRCRSHGEYHAALFCHPNCRHSEVDVAPLMALPHTEAFLLRVVTASAHVPHSYTWSVSVRNASHPIVTLAKLVADSQVSDAFNLDASLERKFLDANACSSWLVVDHLDVCEEK
jgi:hypothetical protein